MSEYVATVSWHRNGAAFTDKRYSRKHTWRFDGGTEVPASSSPHVVPAPFSDPAAVDPEEAFVASLSSCHMLWFLSIACRRGFVVDGYDDNALGTMEKNSDEKLAMTRVTLRPNVSFAGPNRPTGQVYEQMHHEAHNECFIANSVKTEVVCEPTIS
jgi:organic hydroperoxide reductase OsmC/OhrA